MFPVEVLKKISQLLAKTPGVERFGFYAFLPYYFFAGAALEYTMIHWRPNGHNFYDTFLKRQAHETAIEHLKILGELNRDIEDI